MIPVALQSHVFFYVFLYFVFNFIILWVVLMVDRRFYTRWRTFCFFVSPLFVDKYFKF